MVSPLFCKDKEYKEILSASLWPVSRHSLRGYGFDYRNLAVPTNSEKGV